MGEHINVTLSSGQRKMDMRIPTQIEVTKLIKEIDNIFGRATDRRKYQIRVINKGLILDEGKVLAHYPVTTGDLLEIEEV
ncbi:EsaB/YukD family protein [Streptococcus loxodontisalivarius]|uniref:Ubiquitin-like protein YukD n=1 Tax=Streptococcus loxodontisalivarius TaxID=1349415 RepID=A0ABS2PT06_9STRE|nr:EsaB/YukD family protein [Streptococcus loxodontisalivarius]MBM7643061.1 putative ubiquitin-like protein YukD [Streptococcus loxodontisalivarius]